jgi:NTE family protein
LFRRRQGDHRRELVDRRRLDRGVSTEEPRSRKGMRDYITSLLPGRTPQPKAPPVSKRINLALQGGGAHGAFTWGVLDHLLDDERLSIEGISGTSAGAMNAVMLADGLARGGRAEAKQRLADFWRAVSSNGKLSSLQRSVMERLLSFTPLEGTPVQAWFDALSHYFSPYDVNPLNINPLRDVIERFVDFEALRAFSELQIFISATNVQTGRVRIFPRDKITADAVMASACLPLLFRAVEIDGVPYWDGGYLGNPVIFPFFRTTRTEDVLVVQINPLVRHDTPMSSSEIMNRINEITFNSSLLGEYRAIDFVARLIDQGRLPHGIGPGEYRRINVHRIVLDRFGTHFDARSKLSTDYDFFEMLRESGRRAARHFLDQHFDDLGNKSTVDLRTEAQAEWA